MAKELAPVEIFNERKQLMAQSDVLRENKLTGNDIECDPRFYGINDFFDLSIAILEAMDGKTIEDPETWLAKEANELTLKHTLVPGEVHTKLADIYILTSIIANRTDTNLYKEVLERLKSIK